LIQRNILGRNERRKETDKYITMTLPPSSLLLLLGAIVAVAMLPLSDAFRVQQLHPQTIQLNRNKNVGTIFSLRAGSIDDSEYDYEDSDEEEEYDEYDEEDEEDEDAKLSVSAIKAMKKAQAKKQREAKSKVSTSLHKAATSTSKPKPTKAKKTLKIMSKIPYVIRAFMNPFTVIAMTKGYFASLVNIDYMKEDTSQTLRSALQQKAKTSPSGGKRSRARKMKPGQAKTISDLPVLNT
jgi:hypothetical protein